MGSAELNKGTYQEKGTKHEKLVLAATVLLLSWGAHGAASPEMIPVDVKGVVLIQAEQFTASPFVTKIRSDIPELTELSPFDVNAIDAGKVKDVTIFFNGEWTAMHLEVSYDALELEKKLLDIELKKTTIAAKTAFVDDDVSMAIVFLRPNEILAVLPFVENTTPEKAAAYVLNKNAKKLSAKSAFSGILKGSKEFHILGAVTNVGEMVNKNTSENDQKTLPMQEIESIQRMVFSFKDAADSGLTFQAKFLSDSPENGAKLQESFLGVKAMMGMTVASMPVLGDLVKSFTVKQKDAVTDISLTVKSSDIDALLNQLIRIQVPDIRTWSFGSTVEGNDAISPENTLEINESFFFE